MSSLKSFLLSLVFLPFLAGAKSFPTDLPTFNCEIKPLTKRGLKTAKENRDRFAEACLACIGDECAMRIWPAGYEDREKLCRNTYCLPKRVERVKISSALAGQDAAGIRAHFEISGSGVASLKSATYTSGVSQSYIGRQISSSDQAKVYTLLRGAKYEPIKIGGNRKSLVNIEAELFVPSMANAPNYDPAPKQVPSPQNPSTNDNELVTASSGTGFFVSNNGHLITNNHVIEHCAEVKLKREGRLDTATVISRDQVNDLALLKSGSTNSSTNSLSLSNPELLQDVYAAGFPFGSAVSSSVKVTKGIVSSLSGVADNFSNVQIDAALQPGNSGGPIVDDYGNAVAVAVSKLDLARFVEL